MAAGGTRLLVLSLTMLASLSRVVGFRALHHLARPDWSAERNQAAFGPLADPAGHAHDYRCIVTVRGPIGESHGMVMDLVALDRLLSEEVVGRFDGAHLNRDVAEFADGRLLPTCEAIATHVFSRVAARLPADVGVRQENEQSVVQEPLPERTWHAWRWAGAVIQHASLRCGRGSLGVERVPILST